MVKEEYCSGDLEEGGGSDSFIPPAALGSLPGGSGPPILPATGSLLDNVSPPKDAKGEKEAKGEKDAKGEKEEKGKKGKKGKRAKKAN